MLRDLISQEENSIKEPKHSINLGVLYIVILIILMIIVSFYGVYRNQNLVVYIPFVKIWPLLLIAVGLSIFKVKGSSSLSTGFFLMVLTLGLTIGSVFVQADTIKEQRNTTIERVQNTQPVNMDMEINSTQLTVGRGQGSQVALDFVSNYTNIDPNIYIDEKSVMNVDVNQLDFSPGIGNYRNELMMNISPSNPLSMELDANLSEITLNLEDLIIQSLDLSLTGSQSSIQVGRIESESVLNLTMMGSIVDITIPQGINVLLSTSNTFTISNIVGLAKKAQESRLYESIVKSSPEDTPSSTLIINLNATFSQVNLTQK